MAVQSNIRQSRIYLLRCNASCCETCHIFMFSIDAYSTKYKIVPFTSTFYVHIMTSLLRAVTLMANATVCFYIHLCICSSSASVWSYGTSTVIGDQPLLSKSISSNSYSILLTNSSSKPLKMKNKLSVWTRFYLSWN